MNSPVEHKPYVEVRCNGDFLLVETYSGYRSYSADPAVPQTFLAHDAEHNVIGDAVLRALSLSRQISIEEIPNFFNYERTQQEYAKWIAELMARFSYKTKRALFKDMMNVGIEVRGDIIEFTPTKHETLEGWGREKNDGIENVIIPVASSPSEVGEALRLALSRCI